jgi:hypothetical protein
MLSAAQQRGRLRSLVVRSVKRYNIAREFKSMLSGNNQRASGSLAGQIGYYGRDVNVSVSSNVDSGTGYIDDVEVTVEIPWGDYGKKLDQEAGDSANAEGQMIPSIDALVQWIERKGIQTSMTVTSSLKSGGSKEYTYTDTMSSKKRMAWFVQQNIIDENELRTRYDYSDLIRDDLQVILDEAVEEWFSEIGEDFMGDVFVEIGNIIG